MGCSSRCACILILVLIFLVEYLDGYQYMYLYATFLEYINTTLISHYCILYQ